MNERLHREQARNRAEQIAKEAGFTALPIDPLKIATNHGITCKSGNLNGCFGCLIRVGESFGILYSSELSLEGVINFTIGHELGHYFLPGHPEKLFPNGDGTHRSMGDFSSRDPWELQADHFAAGLLMPEGLFREEIRKTGDSGFKAIERLSKACKTSLTATAIRYSECVDYPLATIVSAGNQIDYCFMSPLLKECKGLTWIKKGDQLPKDSLTFEFNRDPDNIKLAKKNEGNSFLDLWSQGAPAVEFNEDVIGLGKYGKTLTILFTDQHLTGVNSDEEESQ